MQSQMELESLAVLKTRIDYVQRGGRVQRMHMVPTLHSQNVAAHSFGVAWWCWLLSHDNKPSASLLMAALAHDLPEGYLGDIPAPTKRNLGVNDRIAKMEAELDMEHMLPVFELSELESRLLKLADSLELLQHCVRERQLGNHTPELREMKSNVLEYANEVARTKFEAAAVNMLSNAWEEVR